MGEKGLQLSAEASRGDWGREAPETMVPQVDSARREDSTMSNAAGRASGMRTDACTATGRSL